MCLVTGLFVVISLFLGTVEIGLIAQPLLNIGYGYFVARDHKCQFRWPDAMMIIMASGTVLLIVVSLTLISATVLGPLMGLINAVISVVYIPYRAFIIFPKGGRAEKPSFVEDVKNILDERMKGEKAGKSILGSKDK